MKHLVSMWNLSLIFSGIAILIGSGVGTGVWGAPPIEIKVTGDRVNLRAAPGLGGASLGRASLGQRLIAQEIGADWVKVMAPENIKLWVYKPYVREGRVDTKSLRIRCGPSLNYSVLGELARGEQVTVLGSHEEWLWIKQTPRASVYISANFVLPVVPGSAPSLEEKNQPAASVFPSAGRSQMAPRTVPPRVPRQSAQGQLSAQGQPSAPPSAAPIRQNSGPVPFIPHPDQARKAQVEALAQPAVAPRLPSPVQPSAQAVPVRPASGTTVRRPEQMAPSPTGSAPNPTGAAATTSVRPPNQGVAIAELPAAPSGMSYDPEQVQGLPCRLEGVVKIALFKFGKSPSKARLVADYEGKERTVCYLQEKFEGLSAFKGDTVVVRGTAYYVKGVTSAYVVPRTLTAIQP